MSDFTPEQAGAMVREYYSLVERRYYDTDLTVLLLDLEHGLEAQPDEVREILLDDAAFGRDAPRVRGRYPSIRSLGILIEHSESIGDVRQAHNYRGDIKAIRRREDVAHRMNRTQPGRGYRTTAKRQHKGLCVVCAADIKPGDTIWVELGEYRHAEPCEGKVD